MVTSLESPRNAHSYFPDPDTTAGIVARAVELRGGGIVASDGHEPDRDPAVDVLRVWQAYIDRPGLHWQDLAAELGRMLPERYAGTGAEEVSAMLRAVGVASVDVEVRGVVNRRVEVEAAARRRDLGSGSGGEAPRSGGLSRFPGLPAVVPLPATATRRRPAVGTTRRWRPNR